MKKGGVKISKSINQSFKKLGKTEVQCAKGMVIYGVMPWPRAVASIYLPLIVY